jgi:hypothetical protein
MLIKILGGIDFLSGLLLIFGAGTKFPNALLISLGIILLLKSCFGMLKDFASWVDFLTGIIFIASIFFLVPNWICIIAGALILQKGLFSFF